MLFSATKQPLNAFAVKLLYGIGVLCLLAVLLSIGFDTPYFLALPVLAVGVMAVFSELKYLYFLLVASLPLSIDLDFGGMGLAFPSEGLMILLSACFFLLLLVKTNIARQKFWRQPIFYLLILHWLWILFAAIMSQNWEISFKFLIAKTWFLVPFGFMTALYVKNDEHFKPLLWGLLLATVLVDMQALLRQMALNFDFEFVNKSVTPFFANHVDYATFQVLIFPYALLLRSSFKKNSLARLFIDASMLIMVLAIALSYTRAAYVALAIIPVAIWLIKNKLIPAVLLLVSVGAVVGVLYLSTNNRFVDYAPNYDTTLHHKNFSDHLEATIELTDMSAMERVYRWIAGFRMSAVYPLHGFGPATFASYYKSYTSSMFETYVSDNEEQSTVHLYYLLVLLEQGVPGFLIFMALIFAGLLYAQKAYHRKNISSGQQKLLLAATVSLMIMCVVLLVGDLVEADALGPFLFMSLAIIARIERELA
ncbi:MAG: O-antigen ligase family protein [Chitinophagales bacterium]|nr:O-antigen ligase family protein [Bacteroidota bacterium]MCB9043522.1 O-antigen ligase family protein [Chitinophagales bacterium]